MKVALSRSERPVHAPGRLVTVPELPDVLVYLEAVEKRTRGGRLLRIRIASPFLLRTVDPPLEAAEGRGVEGVDRLGKRLVLGLEGGVFLVIHLMIAGRLRWFDSTPRGAGKIELARFEFSTGTLVLTEAGNKKRASLHVVAGRDALARFDPGGLDVLAASPKAFEARLRLENHTLKRALTDPRLLSGIGNAYSDEVLHGAGLSPLKLTKSMTTEEAHRLHAAAVTILTRWHQQLRRDFGLDKGRGRFPGPGEITAFRKDFAVHGRFGMPCPVCRAKVQRIVYAENECNYCPGCQTHGRVLADRSLSRLLKEDWAREAE
jgi:formamidopyrimidine-DNA glycosylase